MVLRSDGLQHLENWCMKYSYFEISRKPAVFGCLTNSYADCARELFKPSKDLVSLLVCNDKKLLVGGFGCFVSCGFFVSDITSEVVFGPFWLMLPGLGSNH